jgi:hypothetical protein
VILIEVPALDPSLEQSIDLQFRILVCGGYPRVADPHRAKILSRHVLAKKVLAGGSGKVGGERCRRSAQYDAPLATKGRILLANHLRQIEAEKAGEFLLA